MSRDSPKTGLEGLPAEIIDHIGQFFSKKEASSFRLVSRRLCALATHLFYQKHFEVTAFMLVPESLDILVKLCKNPNVSPSIKELQLCLVTFTGQDKQYIPTRKPFSPPEPDGTCNEKKAAEDHKLKQDVLRKERRRAWGRTVTKRLTMRYKSQDVDMLAEALQHLNALESISITSEQDPDNLPCGAREIQSILGVMPQSIFSRRGTYSVLQRITDLPHYHEECRHAMACLFGALARTSNIKLKGRLLLGEGPGVFDRPQKPSSRWRKISSTPALTFSESQIPDVQSAFSELKELEIHANTWRTERSYPQLLWLPKYTSLWKSVTSLTLKRGNRVLEHLASSTTHFPQLRSLTIKDTSAASGSLSKFLLERPIEHLIIIGTTSTNHGYMQLGPEDKAVLNSLRNSSTMLSIRLSPEERPGTQPDPGDLSTILNERYIAVFRCFVIDTPTNDQFQQQLECVLHIMEGGSKESLIPGMDRLSIRKL